MTNWQAASAIGCSECWRAEGCRSRAGRAGTTRRVRPAKALRSYVEAYGRLVAPAVFNTDVVE